VRLRRLSRRLRPRNLSRRQQPGLRALRSSAEAVIIDRQDMGVQAQNGKPISGDPCPTNTRPTGSAGQLIGEPETIRRRASPDNKFGIRIQNKSLKMAADAGYSVVQQPKETQGRDGKPLLTEAQQRDLGLNQEKPRCLDQRASVRCLQSRLQDGARCAGRSEIKSAIIKPTGFWSIWRERT
jgi:hypothetical protein